jgi:hypothetical protein
LKYWGIDYFDKDPLVALLVNSFLRDEIAWLLDWMRSLKWERILEMSFSSLNQSAMFSLFYLIFQFELDEFDRFRLTAAKELFI